MCKMQELCNQICKKNTAAINVKPTTGMDGFNFLRHATLECSSDLAKKNSIRHLIVIFFKDDFVKKDE